MKKPFTGDFRKTQGFGENPESYAKFGLRGHNGIDWAVPTGTPLLSPIGGIVIEASLDINGYGNYIKIENDIEGFTVAHLQKFSVAVGDSVRVDSLIGYSDNTGNSTGPHVHFGYFIKPRNRQNGYAGYIDPSPYFELPKIYTQEQYDAVEKDREKFWQERDKALEKLDLAIKAYNELNNIYTGIKALGIKSNEELLTERRLHDELVEKLNRELSEEKSNVAKIANTISTIKTEESVSVDEGIEAKQELREAKSAISEIIGAFQLPEKTTVASLVGSIYSLLDELKNTSGKKINFKAGILSPPIAEKHGDPAWLEFVKITGLGGAIFGIVTFLIIQNL